MSRKMDFETRKQWAIERKEVADAAREAARDQAAQAKQAAHEAELARIEALPPEEKKAAQDRLSLQALGASRGNLRRAQLLAILAASGIGALPSQARIGRIDHSRTESDSQG